MYVAKSMLLLLLFSIVEATMCIFLVENPLCIACA